MLQHLLKEYSEASKIEKAYVLLVGLFCVSLPLEGVIRAVPNLLLIPLGIIAPFVYIIRKPTKYTFLLVTVWGGFIVLAAIIGLVGGMLQQEGSFFIRLLLIALVVLLMIPIVHWGPVKRFFVLGVALALLLSMANLLIYALKLGEFNFSSGSAINQVLVTDRLYLGFFATLALVFCIELASEETGASLRLYSGIGFLCILFVLLVAARMALLSILILGACYFIYTRRYKQLLIFVLGAILTLMLFFAINPNLRNRFLHADKRQSFLENVQQWEPRFLIWSCSIHSFSNENFSPTKGFGSFIAAQQALEQCYASRIDKSRKKAYYNSMRFNPHNQFLEWAMLLGFLAGIAFVAYMVLLAYSGRNAFSSLGWSIAFLLFALVESFIHRQMGVYLFALLIALCSSRTMSGGQKATEGADY